MSITDILPKPATAILAGKEFLVSELSLDDLAEIQAWITSQVPHPLQAVKEHLEGLQPAERKFLLEKAYEEAGDYPPRFGTRKGNQILGSTEGMAFQFFIILRKHQSFTLVDAKELVNKVTLSDFERIFSLANNLTPEEEINQENDTDPKV